MAESQLLVAERYRLVSQLGSGGMGRVWLAHDDMLARDVAIKEVVLPDSLTEAEREDLCVRTLREARAAGRLNHPNVVKIYDVVQFEGRPWIVMELVRSRSLYQVIKMDGPVTPKRAAEIGLAVVAALHAAHGAGVWHRDVKPGNVLLADDGRVVLTDFGLATFDGDGAVTRSGLILGSAQYIAPERARDGVSGPQSDMWSLGATLYAAVEGRSPFARESSMATLLALASDPPDEPRRAGPLRGVLIGLLRKNPRQRLTAAQTEKELRRVVDGEVRPRGRLVLPRSRPGSRPGVATVAPAVPATRPPLQTATEETYPYPVRRRRRWAWVTAALAVAVAAPVAVLALDRGKAPALTPTAAPSSSAVALTLDPGQQTQACLQAPPQTGLVVSGPTAIGALGAQPGWLFHQQPGVPAYRVMVPNYWRTWSVGPVTCFRDPTSAAAAAVIRQGRRPGTLSALVTADLAAWQRDAGISGYAQTSLRDVSTPEGQARLEYEYEGAEQRMHGSVWLSRRYDEVYLLGWVSPAFGWGSDVKFASLFQVSFDVDG